MTGISISLRDESGEDRLSTRNIAAGSLLAHETKVVRMSNELQFRLEAFEAAKKATLARVQSVSEMYLNVAE